MSDAAPLITASLNKGQLTALSHFRDVSVYKASKGTPQAVGQRNMIKMGDGYDLPIWNGPIDLAPYFNSKTGTGSLVHVGQLEPGRIDFQGLFKDVFRGGNRIDTNPTCSSYLSTGEADVEANRHATQVASVLIGKLTASNPNIMGIAPEAYLSMSNFCGSDLKHFYSPALDWVQSDGATPPT